MAAANVSSASADPSGLAPLVAISTGQPWPLTVISSAENLPRVPHFLRIKAQLVMTSPALPSSLVCHDALSTEQYVFAHVCTCRDSHVWPDHPLRGWNPGSHQQASGSSGLRVEILPPHRRGPPSSCQLPFSASSPGPGVSPGLPDLPRHGRAAALGPATCCPSRADPPAAQPTGQSVIPLNC